MPEYNGILLIDKPQGFTSFDVVAKLRGIAKTRKIGHAGTLDPMATGVLPLFFGRAAKACGVLPREDKRYLAELRLGVSTDTQDITGQVLGERPVTVGAREVCEMAREFVGEILQLPPMYSALKVNGQKLCDLARKGIEVERTPRPITIYSLDCEPIDEAGGLYRLEAHCSKGTYIRTLAHDLGERLGCGAALTALRRTMAAGFAIEDCLTLEAVQAAADIGRFDELLAPVENAFATLPRAVLTPVQTRLFRNGVRLDLPRVCCAQDVPGPLAVYGEDGFFWGLAVIAAGELRQTKIFSLEGSSVADH